MKLFTHKFLLFFVISLSTLSARGSVVANFTASSVAGCSPLVVNFINTSTPITGSTFSWNLGLGGMPVPTTNASSSYIIPGTYTITLTATNGGVTSTHSITITVYPSPVVSFTASTTSICPGVPVTFTSTSTSGVPGPVTCTWSFGDGTTGVGSPISHAYSLPGTYNVTLSVTNADGCLSSLLRMSYITVYVPAGVNFSASPTYFCNPPGLATFTNMTIGTGPLSYSWRFGDGSPGSVLASPTHTYSSPGMYSVTLIATDGHGCTDSMTRPSYIFVSSIHAAFTNPATACLYNAVTFTNTSSTHISSNWNYGDGSPADTSNTGSHIYSAAGSYTITLIVFDGFCYDTITHRITITAGPAGSFTISPTLPCPPPTALTFTPAVPAGTLISWLYGDGTMGTSPTHTYWRYRSLDTIKMIVINPATGCKDTIARADTLFDMIPGLTASPIKGCKPLTVNFSATLRTSEPDTARAPVVYPSPVTSYTWDYADGTPLSVSGPTPSHTFTAAGTYPVIVTMTTANGCTARDTILIRVGAPPIITVTVTPTHECFHGNLIFYSAIIISGPVDSFDWDFGSGMRAFSSVPFVSYHFPHPGIYTATVTPYYNGCPGLPVLAPTVTIDSPMAIIWDSVYCNIPRTVQFWDYSMGDDAHIWSFGDGTTSTVANPLHTFPAATVYTVTLTTYNSRSGCRDTVTQPINLLPLIPHFSAPDTAICRDQYAVLTATGTGGGSIGGYWWYSAGSPTSTSGTATYVDTFHTRGLFTIMLVLEDQNFCFDTLTRPYILVAKPIARFTVAPTTGCWPLSAVFTDASTDVTGALLTAFSWDFGDGSSGLVTTPTVTHIYTAAGSFTATEIVTDNIGCMDTSVLPAVTVWRPSAVFSANQHPCPGDNILFTNTSASITSSYWMFGDGTTSTLTSPWHTYTATGSYTVKLAVTDTHGCTDTANYINYIVIAVPHAAFYMNDSTSICPPLLVSFTNTSTGGSTNSWTMGDGSGSALPSPSNLYISTGFDTVRLVVTNAYGCKDTAYGHVSIFGYAGAFSYTPDSGCVPLTVHFTASTLNVPSIIWDFADGTTSSMSYTDTTSHIYTRPGAYLPKLILSDGTGCQNSSIGIDTIKVDAMIPVIDVFPTPVCLGDTFMLVDSSWSYYSTETSHTWTMNGISTTADSPTYFINSIGSFPATITLTDGWGCTATLVQNVNIYGHPVITASPDTIICVSDAATLTGYGGVSYSWSPAGTLSCINCNPTHASPTVVTNYTVTGMDIHGCTNTDTVSVFLKTLTVSTAKGDTQVCVGVPVPLYDSGGTKYTWIPDYGLDDDHSPTPIATPPMTTKYMAIAQLASCIPDTNYVTVLVHPLPTVDAGPDQLLVAGSTADLHAKGHLAVSYLWDNASTLTCDTCAATVASMSVTTTYAVAVTSEFGCKNSDSVTIRLYCGKGQIFIPNSFTPNGDGQNDKFYPRGSGVKKIKSFRIYNRWGELMFERSDFDINDDNYGWDGSYKGDVPRPDVYVYVVDALCETGEPINIKGDVTIIR
jgi:gliding motility-associated-like protein